MFGCSRKGKKFTFDDITKNTILIKSDGEIRAAIVEKFDKDYYDLSELSEFVKKEVDSYNNKVGEEEVLIDDVVIKGNRAIVILTYSGMEHYSGFNNVRAASFNADVESIPLELPEEVLNIKNKKPVSLDSVLEGKNRVLVLYEPYDIHIEGKIKYYSSNVKLEGKRRAESTTEDPIVIIYKP